MGNNVPLDYLGYDHSDTNMTWAMRTSVANKTLLESSPCYNASTDSAATASACYETMMRLAYLNQQSDVGSLILRQGKECLTQDELNQIANEDIADFHPLNCAKLNAKPYPYYDGGVMFMKKNGWFPFYSSRNNNFSNRQQIGVICVGPSCQVNADTGVLQDLNPEVDTSLLAQGGKSAVNAAVSTCYDTATGSKDTANANAAHTCVPPNGTTPVMLSTETTSTQEGDNDSKGDGNAMGCATLQSLLSTGNNTVEQDVALAFILLAVGLVFSWLAYYIYNRIQARKEGDNKFRYETTWQTAGAVDGSGNKRPARPTSASFAIQNPGRKLSRTPSGGPDVNDAGAVGARPAAPPKPVRSASPSKPPRATSGPKIKRTEMI